MLLAVLLTALGITACSKWFAVRMARNATIERLSSTGRLCVNAKYPLTESVLTQIQELSSLRIAIVYRDKSAENDVDAIRLESKSSLFPEARGLHWLAALTRYADKPTGKPFFQSVACGDGTLANATSYPLSTTEPSDAKNRYLILLEDQANSNATSVQAFVLPMVTGLCSSIAIAMIAALIASRIGFRIERLSEHVKKIAQGSFETIVPTGPIDAIYALYESVNSMSEQLQHSSSQIAQNERSRLINLMASGLAHELRNHLTGARLAIQTCPTDAGTQEAISIALKQMKLAEESIQRLLTLRVDTTHAVGESMTVLQIHDSVRELLLPIANHRKVSVVIQDLVTEAVGTDELGGGETWVDDGGSIVGALINLILNAMEAAGIGGKVEVSVMQAATDSKSLEWRVVDDGPGPSPEMAAVMFEPFATSKREGVGLGLAMCKRIAQRQQGDVSWKRIDGHTLFTLRIRST
jgi:signal transduction histidine kinase